MRLELSGSDIYILLITNLFRIDFLTLIYIMSDVVDRVELITRLQVDLCNMILCVIYIPHS